MRRIHFLQQWFGPSDLVMEEALYDTPPYGGCAGLSSAESISNRMSILRSRCLLEEKQLRIQVLTMVNSTLTAKGPLLKNGKAVNAILTAVPSSTKSSSGERDHEM